MVKRPKLCLLAASPLTIHFFLKAHVRELSKHFDVTLVYNPNADAYVLPLELPVREIPVGIQRKMTPLTDIVTLTQLVGIFYREKFDIVISVVPKAGLLGMLAALASRTKYRVHIFQGEVWASANGLKRWLLKSMDTITSFCATSLLAVSASEKKFLEEQGVTRAEKIRVLGAGSISGVDLFRFRPNAAFREEIRHQHNIPASAVVCLFLGRLAVDKGVRELVAAFKICACTNPDLWLLLVGPDEETEVANLRQLMCSDILNRVVIDGFTDVPERYLAAADFLCLPSYREGFGMVVLEAAATKIPAIGSRIYGISDAIVEESTGLLVSAKDVDALANAISSLASSSEKRFEMGRLGRERVEAMFDQARVVERYVSYFCDLVINEKAV